MSSALHIPVATQTIRGIIGCFPKGSLRARLAVGAIWCLIGAMVSQGFGLAASVVTARLLGKTGFGELGMVHSTISVLGIFAGLGLGLTGTKYVSEFRSVDPDRAGRITALSSAVACGASGLVSALLFVFAPTLAATTLNARHLTTVLRIGAGLLFLNAVTGAQAGVLSGLEAFKSIALVNLVRGVCCFPLTVAGVLLWRLPGAVWGLVAAAALGWLLNRLALARECARAGIRVSWRGIWSEGAILWKFSFPAFLSSSLAGPVTWLTNIMLVNQPNGYAEMGIFSLAQQWRTAISFLPAILCQTLLPILSSLRGEHDGMTFRRFLWGNVVLVFSISAALAAVLLVASPWIIHAYGPDFAKAAPVFIVLILTTVLSSTASVMGQAIASSGQMWWGLLLNSVWALVFVAGSHLLIPRYEALGLGLATLFSYVVHTGTAGIFVASVLGRMPCRHA